jgi:GTPase SAR1 family protein
LGRHENLNATDRAALEKLEQLLGRPLVQRKESRSYLVGYVVNRDGSATSLTLGSCGIGDIRLPGFVATIASLTSLTTLNLSDSQVSDISPLASLTSLTALDLSDNQLSDISPLASLTSLTALDLSGNQLSDISPLASLTSLTELYLYNNQLSDISPLASLTSLTELYLYNNQLSDISLLASLTSLTTLELGANQLSDITPLASLTGLTSLALSRNQLSDISPLASLANLTRLGISRNQLSDISPLASLTNLTGLDSRNNQLTTVPRGFFERDWEIHLDGSYSPEGINLDGNPLEVPPIPTVKRGRKAVLAFFDELEKGKKKRYQGKLLILGNGDQGKTCVSRALRGLKFSKQNRTKGVQIKPLTFDHPDFPGELEKEITLYLWDFEGQEINHQSHQFFLTKQSLYLLVFKGRQVYPQDEVEYWLDTVRVRAPGSRVILVATECEDTTPNWPLDQLKADYADLLTGNNWYFPVGCQTGEGIKELSSEIESAASSMESMGIDWPESYSVAEEKIRKKRVKHLERAALRKILIDCGISSENVPSAADTFEQQGIITQFRGYPELEDFVVLNPQWLTKAISVVMEDKELKDKRGDITHKRMRELWEAEKYCGIFVTLHNCMKHFELCYDLEDTGNRCLVPLHFSSKPPDTIPWSPELSALPERRIEYKIDVHPPAGLMSRFIVKTHRMIVSNAENEEGVFWNRGVFLAKGEGPLRSEALCVFDPHNRVLILTARAAFPQNMLEHLDAVAQSVFSFYKGLNPVRRYGCIKGSKDQEVPCDGRHPEKRIYLALRKKINLPCERGDHVVEPHLLVYGFSSFGERVDGSLTKEMGALKRVNKDLVLSLSRQEDRDDQLIKMIRESRDQQADLLPAISQQIEQASRDYHNLLGAQASPAIPGVWGISPSSKTSKLKSIFKTELIFTPYCECDEHVHSCSDASIKHTFNKAWWAKTAPKLATTVKWLSRGLALYVAGAPIGLDPKTIEDVESQVSFMKDLASEMDSQLLQEQADSSSITSKDKEADIWDLTDDTLEKRLVLAGLELMMEEIAPVQVKAKQWGSLRASRMPDGSYRWLCAECRERLS